MRKVDEIPKVSRFNEETGGEIKFQNNLLSPSFLYLQRILIEFSVNFPEQLKTCGGW